MHVIGTLRATRGGFAFLIRDDGEDDVLIASDGLHGAIHGDRVRVLLFPRAHDFRPIAVVEEILDRPHPFFTGNLLREGRGLVLRPDSPLLPERLPVRLGSVEPIAGSKVLFRVETGHRRHREAYAVLERTLGEADDARLDPVVIASEFGLDLRFSEAALEEAETAATVPGWCPEAAEEDERREDFRGQTVITIDPVDAKDFDDAIALEPLGGGRQRLFVHIADVTYYVREGGALDREAAERGTSVYFPGSVVPMLPESISSVAASLSPESDKRTLTVVLDLDPDGAVVSRRVARGWIRSTARLHYEQVQAFLDGREEIGEEIADLLRRTQALAEVLRRRRFRHGGFDLEVPEAELRLGPDGVPKRIRRRSHLDSHRLIEEFMIAANRAIGGWARERGAPFLFRVHEPPEPTALEDFAATALTLRPGTRVGDLFDPPALRRWLSSLPEGEPMSWVLHRFFLRAMQRAVYADEDRGHFGLGVDGYAHFTSPIRRYPDLFDHRRVKELLDRRPPGSSAPRAAEIAAASTRAEENAERAEREMNLLKTVRYLERRSGKTARAFVTALTPHGLFVELESIPAEGFVPRDSLPAGAEFFEERLAWIEKRSKWELRPGDRVVVQIVLADLRKRRVELRIVETVRGPRSGTAAGVTVSGREERSEGATARRGRKGRRARAAEKRARRGRGTGERERSGARGGPAGRGRSGAGRPASPGGGRSGGRGSPRRGGGRSGPEGGRPRSGGRGRGGGSGRGSGRGGGR